MSRLFFFFSDFARGFRSCSLKQPGANRFTESETILQIVLRRHVFDFQSLADKFHVHGLQILVHLRDRLSELAYAQEEGLAKGLEQGREEGRKAERLSIAYNMKALGLPAETIADATGLSPEEIGRL